MTKLERLYDTAVQNGIYICSYPFALSSSVSAKQGENYFIGINKSRMNDSFEETVTVAHEMGHCVTDSFYSVKDSLSKRSKCEKLADEWAIRTLIPKEKFISAYKRGCREAWEFAEELGVTCTFAEKAMLYYKNRISDRSFS